MMHWADDKNALAEFYHKAAEVAADVGPYTEVPPYNSEDFKQTVALFMSETKRLVEYDSLAKALSAFHAWILPDITPIDGAVTLTFSAVKSYGAVSVEFGYTAKFTCKDDKALRRAFSFCQHRVGDQFEAFEKYSLPKTSATNKPNQTGRGDAVNAPAAPDGESVSFFGDTLEVETRDNKLYYKIKGGAYEKFGVRVWPETIKTAGLDVPQSPGSYPLGRECIALVTDGKVKKVTHIS